MFETLTDVRDVRRCSPLDLALSNRYNKVGCVDVAYYLIMNHSCGGDKDKGKLLFGACRWGKLDVVKDIIANCNINPNGE